ncbi:UDP-galactopyranose mutase [Sphingomonas antarctica]|uniref:UDP-galactopyranose mutase n=1 Tax=Sphingomonas antarctica TaxID=2040274 RepID=UPI0039EB25CD
MFNSEACAISSSEPQRQQLLCFSHLRWNFVKQRPQHLMLRMARQFDVLFWEEPIFDAVEPHLEIIKVDGIRVAVPHLPEGIDTEYALRVLLDQLVSQDSRALLRWYYTPMMWGFSGHLPAVATVYDCMDELANFAFAPPELLPREEQLLAAADVVFTGGHSLYEAKRGRHHEIHQFPSSVDVAHFTSARKIPRNESVGPTLGFYGVIDERMDLALIADLARARPDWTIDMVGPVLKIDRADLPTMSNIRWRGQADYGELPEIVAGWDVAIMPFAINEATRFISPTKTPEYLAAGRPVVSTPIVDVARHYGQLEGVKIAENAAAFAAAAEHMMQLDRAGSWRDEADCVLATMSWDATASQMIAIINRVRADKVTTLRAEAEHYDFLIVGAGFAGSVMAERLAADAGLRVLVVDRRPHIAGNAYDCLDEAGVMIHQYGPHIFHTNSEEIFTYLSRFTEWRPYEHRVLGHVDDKLVPIPINRTTLNELYDAGLGSEEEAAAFLAARAMPVASVETSEDVVIGAVGRELYEKFFRGYTRKQWGLDPSELDKSVTARVPTRTNTDDRYFTDVFQAMPAEGYTVMFSRLLAHPNITVMLDTDFRKLGSQVTYDRMVYTGPIDEFYEHRFGKLPYRSLRFEHETVNTERHQSVATVNYPGEDVLFTRITEYKHLTGQDHPKTSITREYPCAEGDPYYPIPRPANAELYKRYQALADAEQSVTFVGRLATYRYYNMDQVVGQALASYRRLKREMAEVTLSDRIAA